MSEKVFKLKKGMTTQDLFRMEDAINKFMGDCIQHNSRFFYSGKNGYAWVNYFVRGCRIQIKITELNSKRQARK